MNNTIFKYSFEVTDNIFIELPIGAEILTVQEVLGIPCLYARVDRDEIVKEIRTFRLVGTGHLYPQVDNQRYVGTFQLRGGQLVFHLFEQIDKK